MRVLELQNYHEGYVHDANYFEKLVALHVSEIASSGGRGWLAGFVAENLRSLSDVTLGYEKVIFMYHVNELEDISDDRKRDLASGLTSTLRGGAQSASVEEEAGLTAINFLSPFRRLDHFGSSDLTSRYW